MTLSKQGKLEKENVVSMYWACNILLLRYHALCFHSQSQAQIRSSQTVESEAPKHADVAELLQGVMRICDINFSHNRTVRPMIWQ